jgi:hypothetical protein
MEVIVGYPFQSLLIGYMKFLFPKHEFFWVAMNHFDWPITKKNYTLEAPQIRSFY